MDDGSIHGASEIPMAVVGIEIRIDASKHLWEASRARRSRFSFRSWPGETWILIPANFTIPYAAAHMRESYSPFYDMINENMMQQRATCCSKVCGNTNK